ncbi:type II toxin-antitoxin system VapC family toxin [Hoeflea sp.]|uniref:PIN domain-containing protein n=1 Tax=Hoeflea sp. TaxID=1940281 RepID=UPI0019A34BE9|nr:type II toxin-antitoxin system VapC family toxin [Hoeflea sp.]MBC7281799.1 type II toxin-antitoxin system VapC family toxin [Hoeflea sp.]
MNKVGIDTNVLLRLLVDDDPEQRKAVLAFGEGLGHSYAGFVTLISLVEIDWALRKQYGFSKPESASALKRITQLRGVEVQSADAVVKAVLGVENGVGDFADMLIAHLCLDADCTHVVTLDQKAAARIQGMELLT